MNLEIDSRWQLFILLFCVVRTSLSYDSWEDSWEDTCGGSEQISYDDLERLYGQGINKFCHCNFQSKFHFVELFILDNCTYNDERCCYRECDGIPRKCYYEFRLQNFNTMGR